MTPSGRGPGAGDREPPDRDGSGRPGRVPSARRRAGDASQGNGRPGTGAPGTGRGPAARLGRPAANGDDAGGVKSGTRSGYPKNNGRADPRPADNRDPSRTTGPNPRLAGRDVRSTGPGPRLASPSPRLANGSGPGHRGPGRPPFRTRRPPRWLTVRRGEPGRRISITFLAVAIVLTLFAGRLVQIQGMEAGFYRSASKHLQTIPLAALRGTIYGANGQVLAMTVETYTVTADPPQIAVVGDTSLKAGGDAAKAAVAARLAGPLGMPASKVLNLLKHPSSPEYVLLKKGVSVAGQERISALKVDGIYTTPVYARAYPDGAATANVVGFTNVNLQTDVISGQSGIEAQYDKLLSGTPGAEQVEMSDYAYGPPIPLAGSQSTPARNGRSVRLTIVPALQLAAMQACQAQVSKYHAHNCTVVIMRPNTGDILAMAQWPTFYQPTLSNVNDAVNLPDQYLFAPGSTAKVITAAAALEHGGQTLMSSYHIPYQLYRGGQYIHDAEWSPGEHYTIAGIIANSSNIGMSQVVEHVPPQIQYDYLRAFGLDQPTGLNLPGEESGLLLPPGKWPGDLRYTLSFGQGIAVSAVQMASVYATLANGGVRVRPRLLAGTYSEAGQYVPAKPSPSRRVVKAKTARELISALQQVPYVDLAANQPWGIFPGYAVAAKTGTAEEPGPKCALCEWGSSFIGMAPGDNPQVVVAVNVQNPKGQHYGAVVAGPVFYKVMKFALQTLQIPPDGAVAPNVRLNAR